MTNYHVFSNYGIEVIKDVCKHEIKDGILTIYEEFTEKKLVAIYSRPSGFGSYSYGSQTMVEKDVTSLRVKAVFSPGNWKYFSVTYKNKNGDEEGDV